VPAIRSYLEHTAKSTGWDVEVVDGLGERPAGDLDALLFRIAQEAIANVRKHAGASRVQVDVGPAAEGVALRVHDDGSGFATERIAAPEPGHLGLPTIMERAELAGGWARITSTPGDGTTVECWLPREAELGGG
jgi:signal transduction histidine kinase